MLKSKRKQQAGQIGNNSYHKPGMIFLDVHVAYKITEECSYTHVELTITHAHSGTLQGRPLCGLWAP